MARTITKEQIIQINERYLELGSYAAVARELGVSPTTVKKYVAEGYIPEKDRIIRHIDIGDCRAKIERFLLSKEDLSNPQLLVLTDAERKEIEELWEELAI